jgi:Sulfotransferase domain.
MIRSGSTLQFQIVAELVERHGLGQRIEYVPEGEFKTIFEKYDAQPGCKVFKAHICIDEIQGLFACGKAKGVYSFRDIRDVAVSAIKKFQMPFDELIEKKWLDQAVADGLAWMALPNVIASRYETMAGDLAGEARKLAEHLGLSLPAAEIDEIAGLYTLEKQRDRVQQVAVAHQAGGNSFDPRTLLHHNHINSAESGAWKTALSPAQIQILEDRFGTWLQKMSYPLSTELMA